MTIYGTDRRNLKGAAKRSALKADATRYLRAIARENWTNRIMRAEFGY